MVFLYPPVVFVLVLILKCIPIETFIVIPEDASTALAAIYGFTPRFVKGNDHRVGFGFRFGNHADLQLQYEFGPQIYTAPQKPIRVRSASYRQRIVRRRPFLEFLIRAGILDLMETATAVDVSVRNCDYDEPR